MRKSYKNSEPQDTGRDAEGKKIATKQALPFGEPCLEPPPENQVVIVQQNQEGA